MGVSLDKDCTVSIGPGQGCIMLVMWCEDSGVTVIERTCWKSRLDSLIGEPLWCQTYHLVTAELEQPEKR